MPKRYHIQSYGCQMNTTEAEEMAGLCESLGMQETDSHEDADLVLLNSCSVRQAAEDKVYGWGKKIEKTGKRIFGAPADALATPDESNTWARLNTNAGDYNDHYEQVRAKVLAKHGVTMGTADGDGQETSTHEILRQAQDDTVNASTTAHQPLVILTGCMVGSVRGGRTRMAESTLASRASFVDYFMDQGDYERQLPYILMREGLTEDISPFSKGGKGGFDSTADETKSPSIPLQGRGKEGAVPNAALIAKRAGGEHAFIKISEGCDNYCTFCVVPYARGEERHKSEPAILHEARLLAAAGYKHLTLLGQNVNSWGIAGRKQKRQIRINSDQKLPFAALLRAVHEIDGIEKISFITSNPFDFTKDMIQTLALPKIDRYLHMAVQSGSNSVLKRMHRRHTIEEFQQLIADIRSAVPEIEIGTDLIVGFCGETDEEFEDTLRLVEQVRFDVAYMAMYSERDGTVATENLNDDVPREVKKERYRQLATLVEQLHKTT